MSDTPAKDHINALILKWAEHDIALKRIKKLEMDLRKQIEERLIELGAVTGLGTHNIKLNDHETLKLVRKETKTFKYNDTKAGYIYSTMLSEFDLPLNVAKQIMTQMFPMEIVPDIKGYEMQSDIVRQLVNNSGMLIIKPAAPSLEIVTKGD